MVPPIAYQQRPQETTNADIIQCPDSPPFPKFPLPEQPLYNTVLSKQLCDVYAGLEVDVEASLYFEQETLQQSKSSLWKSLRMQRLTSSSFKDICSRIKDFESLADRLKRPRALQTSAMKHGLEMGPAAAKSYAEITGNNVYQMWFCY